MYGDVLLCLLTVVGVKASGSNTEQIYTQTVCGCVLIFLIAVGLTPCGNNTVHIDTQPVC